MFPFPKLEFSMLKYAFYFLGCTPDSTPESEIRIGDLQSPLDVVVKRIKPQQLDDQGLLCCLNYKLI